MMTELFFSEHAAESLQGKVAVVTGATRGIGFAITQLLLQHQVKVAMVSRSEENLEETCKKFIESGLAKADQLDTFALDVANHQDVNLCVEAVIKKHQRIDILINNAAVVSPFKLFHEYRPEEFSYLIDVNLKGPMYLIHAILPQMISQASGDIININSVAGKKVYPYCSTYLASKFGLTGFTESLLEEQRPNNIRIMGVYPGRVNTEMWQVLEPGEVQDTSKMIDPSDVARSVVFSLRQPRHIKLSDITIYPAHAE